MVKQKKDDKNDSPDLPPKKRFRVIKINTIDELFNDLMKNNISKPPDNNLIDDESSYESTSSEEDSDEEKEYVEIKKKNKNIR